MLGGKIYHLLVVDIVDNMPLYLRRRFNTLSDSHGRNTRSRNNFTLLLPSYYRNTYANSFTYLSTKYWNELPSAMRVTQNQKLFKKVYRARFLH